MLAFSRDGFLQVLEGSPERVNALHHRIAVDPRHPQLSLISFGEVVEREFPDWGMAALDVVGLGASRHAGDRLNFWLVRRRRRSTQDIKPAGRRT